MKAHEIISEAEDNDTVYKNWRKEVGTDKQTTRDIVSGPSPKPNRSMSDDLAAMNKKLAKKDGDKNVHIINHDDKTPVKKS